MCEKNLDRLPSMLSNPSSIRRDSNNHLDERCLTPRSRKLRDCVAGFLRDEVLRVQAASKETKAVPATWPEIEMELDLDQDQQDMRKQCFLQVMLQLTRDSVCWNRVAAVEALTMPHVHNFAWVLGTDVPVVFSECLKDDFPLVRRFAVEGLRVCYQSEDGVDHQVFAVGHLQNVALNDQDWRLRAESARALGCLGKRAVEKLTVVLRDSDFWPVRCEAALALGSMDCWNDDDFSDYGLLVSTCTALEARLKDTSEGVRESAATALGLIGSHALRSVRAMILLIRDHDLRVRIAAVSSLGKVVSEAAPRTQGMSYRALMERGSVQSHQDPEQSSFSDTLRLTCRALTATLRDREPCFSIAAFVRDLSIKTPTKHGVDTTKMVETRRNHVRELFHAAEVSLGQIGMYAWPNMVTRLIQENEEDSGFQNRMSLLRGLHCSGGGGATEVVFAMLSEWIAAPALSRNDHVNAIANSIPISGTHLDAYGQLSNIFRFAVLRDDTGEVYVTFGVPDHGDVIRDVLMTDMWPERVYIWQADGSKPPLAVHRGLWNALDEQWHSIHDGIARAFDSVPRLRCLVLCGSGLGGALAKLAAVRLHMETELPGGREFPPLDGPGLLSGLMVMSYGAPNVITLEGMESGSAALFHCSPLSRSFNLEGDVIPLLLSDQVEKLRHRFHRVKGGCCRLRRNTSSAPTTDLSGVLVRVPWQRIGKQAQKYTGLLLKAETVRCAPHDVRSLRVGEMSDASKCYTNSLCWERLTNMMPP